ncbi:MAG: UDP-N-acetylmuramate dehydrogenase [Clostridia bacterium]|nr:UDP-N-acetylmuramate dehydrogenase [Clostridia bacterium]
MQFSFDIDSYIQRLGEYTDGKIEYIRECPMSSVSTFKIGGPCAVCVFCANTKEIVFACECARAMGHMPKILGRGSNILCSDEGYDGVVIVTDNADKIRVIDDIIECECGVSLTACANEAYEAGLCGAEFMYGIPGSIGGAVYMNAGAYGGEMSDVIVRAECLDAKSGKLFVLCPEEMDFSYRHSLFMSHSEYVVLSVMIRLKQGNRDEIHEKMRDFITRRRDKQPLEYPSAGSVFKRCEGHFTAQLIDEAGLKGLTVGGAQVSEKHAGFIINRGGATAADVLELIDKIKEEIYKRHGLTIECEVEYIGR